MIKIITNVRKKINRMDEGYFNNIVITVLVAISALSILYFYFSGDKHLLYGDALSRLNISRKIVDNLTPGFAQLGNVWLPLPQLLMLLFTWNSTLWHSGLAGTIVSAFSAICGGYFCYRTIHFLTNSRMASLFGTTIFATNINLLYMQTTAMSESLFIGISMIITYYLLKWSFTKKAHYLILSAFGITAITLTRYEGLALLITSICIVAICSFMTHRNRAKAEGDMVMFSTLACLGFAVWTMYLTTIFGDPLYWKNYYADTQVSAATQNAPIYAENLNFFEAIWRYVTSVVWMNGLIPFIISLAGVGVLLFKSIKQRNAHYLPLILPFAMALFMVLTLMRNTPIEQPDLTIANLLSPLTSYSPEFNIRYGLLLLPWVALFAGIVFNLKSSILKLSLVVLIFLQIQSYFTNSHTMIYQIPRSISGNNTQGNERDKALLAGMKQRYDGGLMMISALKHDPQMFQMGIDYKNYIHEGTGKYWKKSTIDPQVYAKWVVFDYSNPDDQVTKFLKDSPNIINNYNLVFNYDGMQIYKIKTAPEIIVKQ